MKSLRIEIRSDGHWVDKQVARRKLFGEPETVSKSVWEKWTFDDALAEVHKLLDRIGPKRLISVNEYTHTQFFMGDDGITTWSLFYWQSTNNGDSQSVEP